jgi:glycosyltransferase involved in cell wall biosynthesis
MTAPRVSILLPTYNRANYLVETISSVFTQAVDDFELIVVDDGSTDETRELVGSISDPRVRYLYQQNHGVSAALNTAWRAAQGEYVAMIGSDDVWSPNQLETLLPLIESSPSLGLVYARAQAMSINGHPQPQILGSDMKFPNDPLASLLYGDCICGLACLIRRRCVEQVGGFDESLVANEDWDMWIRMAEITQFAFHNEILARYRMHPTSLTGKRSRHYRRVILDRVRLIQDYYARPNLAPSARAVQSLALRNVYMNVGIRFLAVGAVREAVPYLWRAVRAHGNPIHATARVTGVTLFDLYLSKTRWGVRLVDRLVERRQRMTA